MKRFGKYLIIIVIPSLMVTITPSNGNSETDTVNTLVARAVPRVANHQTLFEINQHLVYLNSKIYQHIQSPTVSGFLSKPVVSKLLNNMLRINNNLIDDIIDSGPASLVTDENPIVALVNLSTLSFLYRKKQSDIFVHSKAEWKGYGSDALPSLQEVDVKKLLSQVAESSYSIVSKLVTAAKQPLQKKQGSTRTMAANTTEKAQTLMTDSASGEQVSINDIHSFLKPLTINCNQAEYTSIFLNRFVSLTIENINKTVPTYLFDIDPEAHFNIFLTSTVFVDLLESDDDIEKSRTLASLDRILSCTGLFVDIGFPFSDSYLAFSDLVYWGASRINKFSQ